MRINEPKRITVQERFAADWGMPEESVNTLVWLAMQAGKANEHFSNGDPHKDSADQTDKNENARNWDREVDALTKRIFNLVEYYGFTDVVYNGIGPTLKRGEQFVEVPY